MADWKIFLQTDKKYGKCFFKGKQDKKFEGVGEEREREREIG